MNIRKSLLAFTCSAVLSTSVFASAEQAISSAEAAQKESAKVGYEWRDTAKIINKARKLAAEGKSDQAISLANKAQQQGRDAYRQYQTETARYNENH